MSCCLPAFLLIMFLWNFLLLLVAAPGAVIAGKQDTMGDGSKILSTDNNYFFEEMDEKTGIFLVGEVAFASDDCNAMVIAWNRLTNKTCILKQYNIFMNGLSIGVGKDAQEKIAVSWEDGVTVSQFTGTYPTILVRRYFDPLSSKYAKFKIINFIV